MREGKVTHRQHFDVCIRRQKATQRITKNTQHRMHSDYSVKDGWCEARLCSRPRPSYEGLFPPSLLSLGKVLHTLEANQEVPRHIHLHSRGIPRVPPQLKKSPIFLPHIEMRVHFPASSGKESRCSRPTSVGGRLNLKLERNSRGHATIPRDPDVLINSR